AAEGGGIDGIAGPAPVAARTEHEDHARVVACPDEDVRRARRAMEEVPGAEMAFLALDDEVALARQHEERLLVRLGVVEAARLAGLEDGEVDADLREATRLELGSVPHHRHVGLEDAAMAEAVV